MEKKANHYIKPNIKVNDFISRHHLMGWELGDGSTEEQLSEPDALGPGDPGLSGGAKVKNNVWGDMD
jgi:hypothetical protein